LTIFKLPIPSISLISSSISLLPIYSSAITSPHPSIHSQKKEERNATRISRFPTESYVPPHPKKKNQKRIHPSSLTPTPQGFPNDKPPTLFHPASPKLKASKPITPSKSMKDPETLSTTSTSTFSSTVSLLRNSVKPIFSRAKEEGKDGSGDGKSDVQRGK
jgi:hypothetical protein